MKNTIIVFKLKNEKEIELTLTFSKLLRLKNIDKETYKECMNVLNKENIEDVFGYIIIIYTAYLCANIDNVKECMKYEEFIKEIIFNDELVNTVIELIRPKASDGFRKPFKTRTKEINKKNKYKLPKFEIEDVEDYYTYYVLILRVSEDVFWNYDYSFILSIVVNKLAFDNYIDYMNNR